MSRFHTPVSIEASRAAARPLLEAVKKQHRLFRRPLGPRLIDHLGLTEIDL